MIYLDHAATTPLHPEARQAMEPFLTATFGNPSSLHTAGQEARRAVDAARDRIASSLGVRSEEVVFTGGGTEADNLALVGAFLANRERPHIITAASEHHAVLDTCHFLESLGAEVTVLPVDGMGLVDPQDVRRALTPGTALVSLMHANNEIGTVAPLAEVAAVTQEAGVLLHTDAVQTAGALPEEPGALGADLISIAAHKFYGPKGVGALIVRRGVRLVSLIHGGGQERGRRAGTENVAGIVGMARALELARESVIAEAERLSGLRDRLIHRVREAVPDAVLNGHPVRRLPNNVHLSFAGVDGEALLLNLDLAGVCASAGSACTAGSLEPSHVLRALGGDRELAAGSIRLSLGRATTADEIETAVGLLVEIVHRLRAGRPSARESTVPAAR